MAESEDECKRGRGLEIEKRAAKPRRLEEFFDILDTNLKQGKQRIVWKDPC